MRRYYKACEGGRIQMVVADDSLAGVIVIRDEGGDAIGYQLAGAGFDREMESWSDSELDAARAGILRLEAHIGQMREEQRQLQSLVAVLLGDDSELDAEER